ncbi:MAG: hypothetical protein S4CHLAM7_04200 [Chlamydiae bacterium]|nr:hypothetical protein [Chlamydiota bacterium]
MKAFNLFFTLIFSIVSFSLQSCPFASGKKDFQRQAVTTSEWAYESKALRGHFKQAFPLAISELKTQFESDGKQVLNEIEYLEEITKNASREEAAQIMPLVQALQILNKPSKELTRAHYKQFISLLREATLSLKENRHDLTAFNLAKELSYKLFLVDLTESDLGYNFFCQLMPENYQTIDIAHLNAGLIRKEIYQLFPSWSPSIFFKTCHRKSHYLSLMSWDPAFYSVRTKISTYLLDKKKITVLRTGCPITGKNYAPTIDPLFLSYLDVLKKEGKKHLYINNQNLMRSGSEKKASKLLHKLAENQDYKDTFVCITLPYNSSFYEQKNLGREEAKQFLFSFINHIVNGEKGFLLPEKLTKDSSFLDFLNSKFNEIHHTYFQGASFFVQRERSQFIDIAYACIVEHLINQLDVDLVNWTCKHGIDRAMSALSVFDAYMRAQVGDLSLQDTLYYSYWPALVYYHRPPDISRSVRALSAIEKIQEPFYASSQNTI